MLLKCFCMGDLLQTVLMLCRLYNVSVSERKYDLLTFLRTEDNMRVETGPLHFEVTLYYDINEHFSKCSLPKRYS